MHAKAGEARSRSFAGSILFEPYSNDSGSNLISRTASVDDLADLHRLVVEPAGWKKADLERQPGAVPQEAVAAEADIAYWS